MIFGLVYSETVAKFPKAIFVVASALLVFALTMVLCVRNPFRPAYQGRKGRKIGKDGIEGRADLE